MQSESSPFQPGKGMRWHNIFYVIAANFFSVYCNVYTDNEASKARHSKVLIQLPEEILQRFRNASPMIHCVMIKRLNQRYADRMEEHIRERHQDGLGGLKRRLSEDLRI